MFHGLKSGHRLALGGFLFALFLSACGGGGGGGGNQTSTAPPAATLIPAFASAQSVVPMGSSTTLSWTLDGSVTSATLDGLPIFGPSGPPRSSSLTVTPRYRQAYTLIATAGTRTETKVVKVAAQGLDVVAGDLGGPGCVDGSGQLARFSKPSYLARDPQGGLVVADLAWYNVRRVSASGDVTSIAGSTNESGYVDGPASVARFGQIAGLTVGPDRSIYLTDAGNHKFRKIAPDGMVTTLADFPPVTVSPDGEHLNPSLDANGNLYAPQDGQVIRISPSGQIDALGVGAPLLGDLAFLPNGTLLALDTALGSVWALDVSSKTHTLLPMAWAPGDPGTGSITGVQAMAVDTSGGIYLLTSRPYVLYRDPNGLVRTVLGASDIYTRYQALSGLAWMGDRLAFGAIRQGGEIVNVVPGGKPVVLAGHGVTISQADGSPTTASFANPYSLALNNQSEVFVADIGGGTCNALIRRVGTDQSVSSLGTSGNTGLALINTFTPHLLPLSAGTILCTDSSGILSFATSGTNYISTYWKGDGSFLTMSGICADTQGTIFFADDAASHTWPAIGRIRKLSSSGQATTLVDTASGLLAPFGLRYDPAGRILAATPNGNSVWAVSLTGTITNLTGTDFKPGYQDGAFGLGRLNGPSAAVMHPGGQILICDQKNRAIRTLSSNGTLSTLGGSPAQQGVRLGASNVSFTNPSDLALTADGDLIITDGYAVLCWTAPFGN